MTFEFLNTISLGAQQDLRWRLDGCLDVSLVADID